MKNVISNFRAEVEKIINENPLHKDEINDIFDLFLSEVEDEGNSIWHEIELAREDINQLINNK